MSFVRVINETRHSVLGGRIRMADSLLARTRGFLFRRRPEMGEGLFLAPCKGVHMYGMRFPLDVLMVDKDGVVVGAHARLAPGSRTPVYRNAVYAIELPDGAISATRTRAGDRLSWMPAGAAPAEVERTLVQRPVARVAGGGA